MNQSRQFSNVHLQRCVTTAESTSDPMRGIRSPLDGALVEDAERCAAST